MLAGLRTTGAPGELHGRSLVPLLRGGDLPPVPLLAEADVHDGSVLVHDGWKLVETVPARLSRVQECGHRVTAGVCPRR